MKTDWEGANEEREGKKKTSLGVEYSLVLLFMLANCTEYHRLGLLF